jgi:WD40 repeat protein
VSAVAFSPDGTRLASAGRDRTVRLWDVATMAPIGAPIRGHTEWVQSVAFSPDGTTLASVAWDGTVRLWDTAEQRGIGPPLTGHAGQVQDVAFSPDGTLLASAGVDRTVRLWPASAWSRGWDIVQREICSRVRRNLTSAQWEQYLPGEDQRPTCPA